jgi:hypothetical protein
MVENVEFSYTFYLVFKFKEADLRGGPPLTPLRCAELVASTL